MAQAMNPMSGPGKLNLVDQRQLVHLFGAGNFAHTLLGNKPASITEHSSDAQFMQALTAGRELNPNFAVVMASQSEGGRPYDTVMMINKNTVRKTMDQHPEVFGLPPAPSAAAIEAKLAELCTPEGLRQATLHENETMLGTLLGFGASNAKQFADTRAWADRYDAVYSTMTNVLALHGEMDSLVKPFGARLWNSDESTLIANDNVNTTLDINERIDALHAEALRTDRNASKESALVQITLDTLFTQPPALRPGFTPR